jgi:3-oxoacyl-[acyl-carrier protein] reductase
LPSGEHRSAPVYGLTGLGGKVALVTGAGRQRSIGHAIAVELAKSGCDVVPVGSGRDPETFPEDEKQCGWRDVDSVADEIRALGVRALPLTANISDEDQVLTLRERVLSAFGRVDIIVNNASMALGEDRVPVLQLSAELWRRILDVNLTGSFLVSKHFGEVLARQGDGGSIVNISSLAAKTLQANIAAYSSSKAGLNALTGCMAHEVARFGIRVNAVLPGLIDTSRMDSLGRGEKWDALIAEKIPLGRAGTSEEVAALVVYLCSDQGSWITGQNYSIDGGRAIGY